MPQGRLIQLSGSPRTIRDTYSTAAWGTIPLMLLQYWPFQQLPPINVTVQQPAGGMPEWVKILISAGVGALFGIMSSVAMEYVKPTIAKKLLKKMICAQVGAEVIDNLNKMEACGRLLKFVGPKSRHAQTRAVQAAKVIVCEIKSDRFDYYLQEHKSIMYEIDGHSALFEFYRDTKHLATSVDFSDYEDVKFGFDFAILNGHNFLLKNNLRYTSVPMMSEEYFKRKVDEIEGEKQSSSGFEDRSTA